VKLLFKFGCIISFAFFSSASFSFDITGEELDLKGVITDVTLGENSGVINVEADNQEYGKTWLTYNVRLSNPESPDQGTFHGRATAINSDGSRASAVRQGVWTRKGYTYSFLSLDDVSDGNQYLCITEMNLKTNKVEMKFYAR
tara:strand:- start:75 stop:503 length:429 start_codon:yes stop_codon:yes gene_type:complete